MGLETLIFIFISMPPSLYIYIGERAIIAFVAKIRFSINVLDEWNYVPKSTAKSYLHQHTKGRYIGSHFKGH